MCPYARSSIDSLISWLQERPILLLIYSSISIKEEIDLKILFINGCDKDYSFGLQTIQKLSEVLTQKGHTYLLKNLSDLSLKPCISCDCCQTKKPGFCSLNDGLNEVLKEYLASDLALIMTPILFGTCNSRTKAFIDRTQPLFMPYQKLTINDMAPRYAKYPDVKFLGLCQGTSPEGIVNLKETFLNCSLALQSKHHDVQVLHKLADLETIHF